MLTKPYSANNRTNWLNTSTSSTSSNGLIEKRQSYCGFLSNVKCELSEELGAAKEKRVKKLGIGSPVIVIEAPLYIKTAASVPCLRANSGLIKAGDVGRIMSRKPKDVWAVRLRIGTYLIDGKYFKPLELDE
ncbi:hypothetical protein LguiB_031864 [Lonicera macranthoides]